MLVLAAHHSFAMAESYQKSGVDINVGNSFVDRIRPFVQRTRRPEVLADVGGFGALFQPKLSGMKEPVLVSGTDGVGTKLRLALELERYETIGQDLVAMCVNDIVCSGAEPLFFLDYLATGKLDPNIHGSIVEGIAAACEKVRCALIGGETAEMPGCYQGTDFDLAGFAVGMVDRSHIIDGRNICAGDAILGLASSGFHSNGYSLLRKIVSDSHLDLKKPIEPNGEPLGDLLLTPTHLYSPLVLELLASCHIKGIAHITGGGFWDNIPRILPHEVTAKISKQSWPWQKLMRFFQTEGKISDDEMLHVFNCGIGMILVVPAEEASSITLILKRKGTLAFVIGTIEKRTNPNRPITIV